MFAQMKAGTLIIPNYMQDVNPPSLFTYYLTMPQWARDHPSIRNVLMAFEYHKPTLDIRQKELTMNLAMSFIRPIDKQLEEVIIEVASSNKVRLNVARVSTSIPLSLLLKRMNDFLTILSSFPKSSILKADLITFLDYRVRK